MSEYSDGQTTGEDSREQSPTAEYRRVTVPEAAEMLGTSSDAVRSRMRRGKLKREDGEDGTVYVLLRVDEDSQPTVEDSQEAGEDSPLVRSLEEQVEYLKGVVEKRDEEIRRRDHLLAAALERIPQIEGETVERQPETVEDSPRRSRWRTFFGV